MSSVDRSLERLREFWTPGDELRQLDVDGEPQTQLDSQIRDFLHRAVQQLGPVALVLERDGLPVINRGFLRWEVVGVPGYREVNIWIEEART